jgi:hypothetical protein
MAAVIFAMGIEEEYAVSAVNGAGERLAGVPVIQAIVDAEVRRNRCVPCSEGGWMLLNGGRLYCDNGSRLEYATGIHTNPFDAVAELIGARQRLIETSQRVARELRVTLHLNIGRIDVATGRRSGTHMNHSTRLSAEDWNRMEPLFLILSPLLTGAGHLGERGFVHSQRITSYCESALCRSSPPRALFGGRRSQSDRRGHCRCHDMTADSSHNAKSMVLQLGLVALLKLALELGLVADELNRLQVRSPHSVLAVINADPFQPFVLNHSSTRINGIELARSVVSLINQCCADRRLLGAAPWCPQVLELAWEAVEAVEHVDRPPFVLSWQLLQWFLNEVARHHEPAAIHRGTPRPKRKTKIAAEMQDMAEFLLRMVGMEESGPRGIPPRTRPRPVGQSPDLSLTGSNCDRRSIALKAAQAQYFDLMPDDASLHTAMLALTGMTCPEITPETILRSQHQPLGRTSSVLIHELVKQHRDGVSCQAHWDRLCIGRHTAEVPHPLFTEWDELKWKPLREPLGW